MPLSDVPRHPLLFGPSPIQRLERLSAHLGGATVWAKREDCNSGLAFGGNKVRKLEYLLADALAQGCDTLVSIGGVQSNHTRAVAAVAAHAGLRCVLVQESWVDWPDVTYDRVGNILLSRLMGADVRLVKARLRDRVQGELGAGDRRDRGRGRPALCDPGRRVGPPARRPRVRGLGVRGGAPGARARRLLRHGHRVLGHRVHTGGHDRRVRRARGRGRTVAACHRHRRVGDAGRDPRPGRADRAPDGGRDRPRARPARGRDHPRRALPRRHLRHPGRADARCDPARGAPRGHDHGPGVRGEVDGRAHRPRCPGRDPATQTCCTRTSAASRRSTRTRRCSARPPARSPRFRHRPWRCDPAPGQVPRSGTCPDTAGGGR